MVSVRLYVEGGSAGDSACRRAFAAFLEKAGMAGKMPRIVACGTRGHAYDRFSTALEAGVNALLLVDAESRVTAQGAWQHLQQQDRWSRPTGASDRQCHLMVQCMESWFLADVDALASYFGQGFQRRSLPRNRDVEEVPKDDVQNGLDRAARATAKRGYRKGRDSFDILATLDPGRLGDASPHADRFIQSLTEMADGN